MADHAQCHRDIDQLLAEIKRLRDMLTLCENHCSDGFVAEQARTVLAHRIELIDGVALENPGDFEAPGRGRKVSGSAPGTPVKRAVETTAPEQIDGEAGA